MQRRLLVLARESRLALAVCVVAGVVGGWLIIGQADLLSRIIGGVFLQHAALADVQRSLSLLLLVIICRGLLVWLNEGAAAQIARGVKCRLRERLLRHLFSLGPSFTAGERTGELTTAAIDGIEALDAYYGQYLPQLIVGALVPVSILLVVFPRDWLSGLILLVTAPLIPFFMYMMGRGTESAAARQYASLARLASHFLDSLQGLTTLKAFGQSKAHILNIARVSDQFRRASLRVMQGSFLSAFALELLTTISTAIIAVEVGLRLLAAQMPFDQALFILILAPEFYLPLRMLGQRFHASLAGTAAAQRIFEILGTSTPQTACTPHARAQEPAQPGERGWSIDLEHVSFTYSGRSDPALRDLSLRIETGQHVALLGETGAGKSTLARLILGFDEPTSGRIRVRALGGPDLSPHQRRQIMAWVPHDAHLFNDTISANIRVGNRHASLEQVMAAARRARLDDTIKLLPRGYETYLADSGSRLSSGERQRLALARAFVRDAPILILDEPTSALDPENEALLEAATRDLMRGRTVLTIAHRLNTVIQSDLILVMRRGCVVEAGTHAQLLKHSGEYTKLLDASSRSWRPPRPSAQLSPSASPIPRVGAPTGPTPSPDLAVRDDQVQAPVTTASPSALKSLRRLLGFLSGSWALVALAVCLASLTIGASVALMGTSAWLISMAALHPSIAALDLAIVGVRFFGIARAVARYFERMVTHSVTLRVLGQLRVWFYEHIEPLAPARVMQYASGDLLARAVDDVNILENFYVRVLNPPLVAAAVVLAACAYLSATDVWLAVPLALSSSLIGVALPAVSSAMSVRPGSELVRRRSALRAGLVDSVQGLADVVAYGLEDIQLEAIKAMEADYGEAQNRMSQLGALQSALSLSLANLGSWALLLVAIPLVATDRIPAVMLAPLALITLSAFEAVGPLPVAAQWFASVSRAADRLFDLVDVRPEVEDSGLGAADQTGGRPRVPGLSVRHVSFSYPGQPVLALRDVSFDLRAGDRIAVVGPSGAGKSTLAHLLMRHWEYRSGEIDLAGQSLRASPAEETRRKIGLVASDSYVFDTSIYENLRMAGRGVSRERVTEACRLACIHDFIASLPSGYDTLVGEHGLRLSAGERQRLAIARLLIKDAPLAVLDEPTAHLDAMTERAVLESLWKALTGRSCILITHRLVGLEDLPEILVFDHGGIVERGTHAALVRQGGLYCRLWDLQNRTWNAP